MFVGVLAIELFLQESHSLKEKRAVINSVLDRVRSRFNVSAAQLDSDDLWQRAELGFAAISNDGVAAQKVLHHVRDCVESFCETDGRADVVKCSIEIL